VEVSNPTSFRLIGSGAQGAVFLIDEHRCVKIYNTKQSLDRELHALQLGGKIGICPKVYFWGENFIVMEYLTHPSLFEYLEKNPLTKELTIKIIDLLDSFEKIGYNRFDHSARHIYVVPDGKWKVIDVVHIIKPQPVFLAKKLISDMGVNAEEFVRFVQEISPKWYKRWINHPGFPALMAKVKGISV
jgi:RIO-like serine/threonine protein kinase